MKKFLRKTLTVAAMTIASLQLANAQTYNIPAASTTGTSYLGAATGDLNLKSSAGSLFLNTVGTTTTPNVGLNTDGNVGVGLLPALNPGSGMYHYQPKLTILGVDGNDAVPASSPRSTFRIATASTNVINFGVFGNRGFIQSSALDIYSADVTISGSTGSFTSGTLRLGGTVLSYKGTAVVDFSGSVTIGATPSVPLTVGAYRLFVADGIITEKVKVAVKNTTNWSDFVFDKNYKLRSLSEVEKYIKKNNHLPDVPSAEEVVKEGINLGEMDAKLLQKIEELTLYMIEMKKENEQLKARVQTLEKK